MGWGDALDKFDAAMLQPLENKDVSGCIHAGDLDIISNDLKRSEWTGRPHGKAPKSESRVFQDFRLRDVSGSVTGEGVLSSFAAQFEFDEVPHSASDKLGFIQGQQFRQRSKRVQINVHGGSCN